MKWLIQFLFFGAFFRLSLGGDSESNANTTNEQYDQRATTGTNGVSISNGSNNVITRTETDFGSVQAGLELSRQALGVALLSTENATTQTSAVFNSALSKVGEAFETAKAGDQRVVSMVGLAVIGLAAIMVVPALFKKG